MWIPKRSGPDDPNIVLLVSASADLSLAFHGTQEILSEIYKLISSHHNKDAGVPDFVRVCTESSQGSGIRINPIQAHQLNSLGLLSEEHHRVAEGLGLSGYSQTYFWREVDMRALSLLLKQQPNM